MSSFIHRNCLVLAVALTVAAGLARAQNAPQPSPGARALHEMFDYLLGSWEGEGSGEPGQGTGGFVFELSLDGNLISRRSHAEYPRARIAPP